LSPLKPLLRHMALEQSEATMQTCPATHGEQVPPQSMSVSSMSFAPLRHSTAVGASVGAAVGALVGLAVGAAVGQGCVSRTGSGKSM
jgi:hypothetical protein